MKVSQDGAPGGRFRSVVTGENPSNHVFVDGDVESQGNLLSDARTAPGGIALLDLDDGINEFSTGSSGPGPPPLLGKRRGGDPFGSSGPGGGARESKVSERWRNGSGGTAVSTERTNRRRGGRKGGDGGARWRERLRIRS